MSLTNPQLTRLARTSRRAAAFSAMGAMVVFVAVGLASVELVRKHAQLEDQIGAKRALVGALDTQRRELTGALAQLVDAQHRAEQALADVTDKLTAANHQTQAAQDTVADLDEVLEASRAPAATVTAATVTAATVTAATAAALSGREQARAAWRAGQAARLRKDDVAATRQFRVAIAADPSYAPAYNSLGRLQAANGNLKAAEHYFRLSVARDPSYRAALYNLAKVTEKTHGPADALSHAQTLLKLRPEDARAQALVRALSAAAPR